ncbi:hypothetical protein H4S07_000205 [Coemansia furcata]|uniref:Uncharacterized protein n=1 Tax=Coemansia furcata TaxID=417177 RepID=A0ACC1LS13_9FUNG|nr:hypothetical protein H4S07_000205 [Coemansia furcata]
MDAPNEELLPTYEETLSATPRKRYQLVYPQLISRTVHAIDQDTRQVALVKRVRGLSSTKTQYYAHNRLLWTCLREQQGFELVFTQDSEPPPPPPPPIEDMEVGSADHLHDMKAAAPPPRDPLGPPAYQETEAMEVRLVSQQPFPFAYEFRYPPGDPQVLRWQRAAEPKQSHEGWTMYTCMEKGSGRLLAEITAGTGLGTLVVHGDVGARREMLVVTAIAVTEEYPVRRLSYI